MNSSDTYLIIPKSTHHPTNKKPHECGGVWVCPPKVCPLFGNIWVNVIKYDKQKAPSIDRAFLQRNMVLFSSRGREI